jgi:hypothetical protein
MVLPSFTSMNNCTIRPTKFDKRVDLRQLLQEMKRLRIYSRKWVPFCVFQHILLYVMSYHKSVEVWNRNKRKFLAQKPCIFFQVSLRIVHKTVKICNPKKSQTKDECEQYSKMILKVSSWKNAVFCAALQLLML